MQTSLQIGGLESIQKQLSRLSGGDLRDSFSKAVTDAAYQAQRQIKRNMFQNFESPASYLPKTVFVVPATVENLTARVAPTRLDSSSVDPQKILHAQEFGGQRFAKRYEVALRSAGVLPQGFITSIPRRPFPGSDDGRGNLRGRFVIELLNYFQANQMQVGSMSKRRQAALNRSISYSSVMTRTKRGLMDREVRLLHGFELFVADGSGGIAAGIWARKPVRSRELRPVVIFIQQAMYKPRLGVEEIGKDGELQAYFERRLRFRIRRAVEDLGN